MEDILAGTDRDVRLVRDVVGLAPAEDVLGDEERGLASRLGGDGRRLTGEDGDLLAQRRLHSDPDLVPLEGVPLDARPWAGENEAKAGSVQRELVLGEEVLGGGDEEDPDGALLDLVRGEGVPSRVIQEEEPESMVAGEPVTRKVAAFRAEESDPGGVPLRPVVEDEGPLAVGDDEAGDEVPAHLVVQKPAVLGIGHLEADPVFE